MELPEPFRSPPPRELSQSPELVRHLTRGYRLNAWIGLLSPAVILGGVALWMCAKGRAASVVETLLCPLLCLIGMLGVPMCLWAWSNIRDTRRLLREGVVVPARVIDVSVSPSNVVWVTVLFAAEPGTQRTMRTNVFETAQSISATGELAVLIDPKQPGVAVLLTPSQRFAVGVVREVKA